MLGLPMKLRMPILFRRRRPPFGNPLPGFDPTYYLDCNPDVREAGLDPTQHFLTHGWREGRDPSAGFRMSGYLAANPDVAAADQNPLLHFLRNGLAEGRTGFTAANAPMSAPEPRSLPHLWAPASSDSQDTIALQGFIDDADHARIRGWAFNPASPNSPTIIAIIVNQFPVNTVIAGKFRPDLREANIGSAHHGFAYTFFPPLSTEIEQTIVVRRSADGRDIGRAVLPATQRN